MHYWNRDNFEGLAQLANELRSDARLHDLARYCELRERGLRAEALEALNGFIDAALSSSVEVQRKLVLRVLRVHARAPAAHQFLSHPLRQRLIEPVLRAWCESEPANAAPISELAVLQHDPKLLERALQLNPTDDRVRACLVSVHLRHVDYATHHLVEGKLIGALEDTCAALDEAERHIQTAQDPASMTGLVAEAAEYRCLLADWKSYQQNPVGTFPEWCRQRGRTHRWWSIVYYES